MPEFETSRFYTPGYKRALYRFGSLIAQTRDQFWPEPMFAAAPRAVGYDLSKWDGAVDPSKSVKPIDFVIQRVAYGNQPDSLLEQTYASTYTIPICGAYQYFLSGIDWKLQADYLIALTHPKRYQFYVCDFESTNNVMGATFAQNCVNWLDYVAMQTNKPVLVYTNVSLFDTYLGKYAPQINRHKLWIAQWPYITPNPQTANPKIPLTRYPPDWSIWQYSADGNGMGIYYGVTAANVDLDVFNGTVADMRLWLGLDVPTAPPPTYEEKTDILWREAGMRGWNLNP